MSARRRRAIVPALPPEQPTPERLARAAGGYEQGDNGSVSFCEAPLDRLRSRCALAPDPDDNYALFMAGDRFREDWHKAGLTGLSAIDYNRLGGGSGDPAYAMPGSEFAAAARWRVRNAMRALTQREQVVIVAVVAEEQSPADAGRYLGRKAHVPLARARATELALIEVRSGLTALARHYGLLR